MGGEVLLLEGSLQQIPQAVQLAGDPGGQGFACRHEFVPGAPGNILQVRQLPGPHQDEAPLPAPVSAVQGVRAEGHVHAHRHDGFRIIEGGQHLPGLQLLHGEPHRESRVPGCAGQVSVDGQEIPQVSGLVLGVEEEKDVEDTLVQLRGHGLENHRFLRLSHHAIVHLSPLGRGRPRSALSGPGRHVHRPVEVGPAEGFCGVREGLAKDHALPLSRE